MAKGACEGVIAFGPAGDNGFGYDPVFYMPEQGATMAQLPAGPEEPGQPPRAGVASARSELLEGMLAIGVAGATRRRLHPA